jgi:hypothetical protein
LFYSTNEWDHAVLVFLCLAYFTQYNHLQLPQMTGFHSVLMLKRYSIIYIYHIFFICSSVEHLCGLFGFFLFYVCGGWIWSFTLLSVKFQSIPLIKASYENLTFYWTWWFWVSPVLWTNLFHLAAIIFHLITK